MSLYIMGGAYGRGPNPEDYRHRAVSPGGPKSKPYVFRKAKGSTFALCKHHSHLYRLNEDQKTATLVETSPLADGVRAPETLVLDDDQADGIKKRLQEHGLEGVYDQ